LYLVNSNNKIYEKILIFDVIMWRGTRQTNPPKCHPRLVTKKHTFFCSNFGARKLICTETRTTI